MQRSLCTRVLPVSHWTRRLGLRFTHWLLLAACKLYLALVNDQL